MRAPLSIFLMSLVPSLFGAAPKTAFTENRGQWPDQVLYRALVPGGALFVERSAFTYVLYSESPLRHHGHEPDAEGHANDVRAHAYRVQFVSGQAKESLGSAAQPHYENYFLGNDSSRWAGGCAVYAEVTLKEVWPGIDIHLSGQEGLKYDIVAHPGADPGLVRLRYEGQDGLQLREGRLHVMLSSGDVVEEAPVSYVEPDGNAGGAKRGIASAYVLRGNELGFALCGGSPGSNAACYSATDRLAIDPVLTFSSYSGSTADNFGFTATYDSGGHLYGGGIVFGIGYPTTLGVQQGSFAGSVIDIGISKFSPDGSALIWSTYLGGLQGNETPHSMVVNSADELYVMGATGSSDFPTTPGAFDQNFGFGPQIDFAVWEGYVHAFGSDIVVTHFNATATALVGSTFIGGSEADGLNLSTSLEYNYGDPFRGEIIVDAADRPVIVTSTYSNDMPVSPGAPQPGIGGAQDAYACMLNPTLSNLLWGTYFGGSQDDSGYGVQQSGDGTLYITGGTVSTNLPMAGTPYRPTNAGGIDGYVARYAAGGALLNTTYLGTSAYDQSYFVQMDTQDDVYVVGQTHGSYPVSSGVYANPSGSQFIQKLNPTLSASLWSTRIGTTGDEDIAPSAFLVSNCGQIYFSGWGGNTNNFGQPNTSSTAGLPVSADAYQPTTDGSDFYLMVLEPDAAALAFATFFGGNSAEHVDGGTSRFDKNGVVYQAVCAGCSQQGFPTTPGAWSETNNSTNCNLGVFKFDLLPSIASIAVQGPDSICVGEPAVFVNNSSGGTDYAWDFGDNTSSTQFAPSHAYTSAGDYTVTLILSDNSGCALSDTTQLLVTVREPPVAQADPVVPFCPGGQAQLQASGGDAYLWSPPTGLSSISISNPIATPPQAMTYQVTVFNACGSDTTEVTIAFLSPDAAAGPDTATCLGSAVQLSATGGVTYAWTPTATLDDPSSAAPNASPSATTLYHVTIQTAAGCTVEDSLEVSVVTDLPEAVLADTAICLGATVLLTAAQADLYAWHPANGIAILDQGTASVSPTLPTLYVVELNNPCGTTFDSAFVDVHEVIASAWPDTVICPGTSVQLHASGGSLYHWSPTAGLSSDAIADPLAAPGANTVYTVLVSDSIGCSDDATAEVTLHPLPVIAAGPDLVVEYGDVVQLNATGEGIWSWAPLDNPADSSNAAPFVQPEESTSYTVTTTSELGCKNTDVLVVIVAGSLYLPNTFTPNGDSYNDTFGAWGKEIGQFELLVFNRWGELIWSTDQLTGRWDGTYQGVASPIDTYVWRVTATELSGRHHEAVGHVNLVR